MSKVSDHHISQLEPVVRPLVPPDERYRLAVEVQTDQGVTDQRSRGEQVRGLFNPLGWLEVLSVPTAAARAMFGRAVTGGDGSRARTLHEQIGALRTPGALMVTDTRLRVVELQVGGGGSGMYEGAEVVAEHARETLVGARMAPYGLIQRARFILTFDDGSGCALSCHFKSITSRVVAELSTPSPS